MPTPEPYHIDINTDPAWLKKLAKTAFEDLAALPRQAQPSWFRYRYPDAHTERDKTND